MIKIPSQIEKKREEFNYEISNKGETAHIVFGIDNLFVEPMAVCVLSLIEHNKDLPITIHVITVSISDQNKVRLKNMAHENSLHIILHFVDKNIFKNFPSTLSYTSATYNRFLIPMLLDSDIDRALYLDADILCFGSISELFSLNIDQVLLAAIEDHSWNGGKNKVSAEKLRKTGFKCDRYFNAGVLLINLNKWRNEHIPEKALTNLSEHSDTFSFLDQDALNSVANGRILFLDRKYNYMYSVDDRNIPVPDLKNISLLHYTNRYKLWQSWCDHPLQQEYIRLRNKTEWKNVPLLLPRTYKDMRCMSRYMRRHGQYMQSILWMLKYCIYKMRSKL